MGLNLRGMMVAALTPMHADGAVDLSRIERQAELYRAEGVRGAYVCGTTGEGPSLTIGERQAVAQRWCEVARGRDDFPVIVHVGHSSLAEAKALAAHAQSAGAAGVAAVAPLYYKPKTADDVVACCAEVASAAPAIPFYYYHFPLMTGVDVPVPQVLEKARGRIPNFGGYKFTSDLLGDFGRCLDFARRHDWPLDALFGRDDMLLGALAVGCRAMVGGSYNFTAPLFGQLLDAFDRNDLPAARDRQATARAVIGHVQARGVAAIKAVMPMIGLDLGPPRLPLRAMTSEERDALRKGLEAAGLFVARRA
jgi:N-acetylneuraminate lyase